MYTRCIWCAADLGRNEVVEPFPVGRRLAFDAAKGRSWVVCRDCERWNLTALEERWEAIERCERLFRDTRTRVSTDQIGLARLREGLELVRIGAPQRPEFAAWRYGDQFGRRWRRAWLWSGATTIALGGFYVGVGLGLMVSGAALIQAVPNVVRIVRANQVVARVLDENGRMNRIRRRDAETTLSLFRNADDVLCLETASRERRMDTFADLAASIRRVPLAEPLRLTGEQARDVRRRSFRT